jgi:hypothetical protein
VSPVRYVLPTMYLCVPYGSHSKQRLFPHSVSVCSVRFSQQTATVSPHNINRLGSVAEIGRVSCEVRTEIIPVISLAAIQQLL